VFLENNLPVQKQGFSYRKDFTACTFQQGIGFIKLALLSYAPEVILNLII